MNQVEAMFGQFIKKMEHEGQNASKEEIIQNIARLLQLKIDQPLRPPRLMLLGPPGCGKTTQAKAIADKFGLTLVSTRNLLEEEIGRKVKNSMLIKNCIEGGEQIPDDIIISLVEKRIKQSDCSLNGWILDDYPSTLAQIAHLKSLRLKPTLVVLFECPEDVCRERAKNRRVDPETGNVYVLNDSEQTDQDVHE